MTRGWLRAGRAGGAAVRSRITRWWSARPVMFRKTVRTGVLLLVTITFSLVLGLSTATATSPLGPHHATWRTTVNSTATLDLGPVGTVSVDSPVAPWGVDIVLQEIPADPNVTEATPAALGQALATDGASYMSLVSRPRMTVEAGVKALVDDGLRRAGVIASVILCLVAAGRLATGGRLREAVRKTLSRGPASALAGVTVLAMAVSIMVPALRAPTSTGTTIEVLAGTPAAGARLSGRVANVVTAYGGKVKGYLDRNTSFYSSVSSNLDAAWASSEVQDGTVEVTVSDGVIQSTRQGGDAGVEPNTVPTPWAPGASSATSTATASPAPEASPAPDSAAEVVAEQGAVTAVLTTDLHCNMDVMSMAGRLDVLAGADLHLDDGDLTMTGSEPEVLCVDALTNAVPSGVKKVATIGNHDSEATGDQLRARGWTVTDGRVVDVAGVRILGDVDPDRTTAAGTTRRGQENARAIGARLGRTSCEAREQGDDVSLVLIHQPATFPSLIEEGCAPFLIAGHLHTEYGMVTTTGPHGPVTQLVSGAGKGGTSVGPVTADAFLHVLSFDEDGTLLAWRAVIIHSDASVTVGAWQPVPPPL